MLRKRASTLFGASKLHKTSQQQKYLAPARTLILQSPMSGSMTELNETCEFEFGLDSSRYQERTHTEPLFNETFFLPPSQDASPDPSHASISPVWAFQLPSINVLSAEPAEAPDLASLTYKELDTLTVETFIATTITYTRVNKVDIINITLKRSREISRSSSISTHDNSSISTHDTIFSTHNVEQSFTSTPSSSIYDQPFYSPMSSPEIESKPFRKIHNRTDSAFLDSVEERQKEFVPQPLLVRKPSSMWKEKKNVQVKTTEIFSLTEIDRPSTPNKLRRSKKSVSDVWYRR